MKKNKLAIAVNTGLAALVIAGTAWAAASDVKGEVRGVDVVNRSVTLVNGHFYFFPDKIKLDEIKSGDLVTIHVDGNADKSHDGETITKTGHKKS